MFLLFVYIIISLSPSSSSTNTHTSMRNFVFWSVYNSTTNFKIVDNAKRTSFVIFLFRSQKAFRVPSLFECRHLEDNFLVQSGDFCIHEYEIRSCKEVYISPYPKIVIFKNQAQ